MNCEIQLYLAMWKPVAGGNSSNIRYDFITARSLRGQVVLPVPTADPAECEHQLEPVFMYLYDAVRTSGIECYGELERMLQ
jgi:hypothetical protein